MVAELKTRGYTVKRVGLQGRNDKQLLAEVGTLGDVSDADKVYLYCGGNSSKPTVADIRKLIEYFGADRTTVILPPVNLDRDTADVVKLQAKNTSNKAGIQDLVPVYTVAGHAADFKPDTYHMKAGTAVGKAFVKSILDGAPAPQPDTQTDDDSSIPDSQPEPTDNSGVVMVLVAAAAVGWLLARYRRRQ